MTWARAMSGAASATREGCRGSAGRRRRRCAISAGGVYPGAKIVLITAMQAGLTPSRAQQLQALIGASVHTLKRWRTWWRTTFVATAFWRAVAGRLPAVRVETLPASLLDCFGSPEVLESDRAHGIIRARPLHGRPRWP
jgi:hypothetical protein